VETSDTSTSGTVETVKIEYAIDYDEGSSDANYLTLANSTFTDGLIDTDDTGTTITTFVFPRETSDITVAPVGKTFKAIRFKVSLARGATTTNSPRLISMSLEYRKKLDELEGFEMNLDLSDISPDGRQSVEQRADLVAVRQSSTLVEFTYREDTNSGDPRNYYVDLTGYQAIEDSGNEESGIVLVTLEEA
jgi:hypothetical protein